MPINTTRTTTTRTTRTPASAPVTTPNTARARATNSGQGVSGVDQPLPPRAKKPRPLADAFAPSTVWKGSLAQRLEAFAKKWPSHVKFVDDVRFDFGKDASNIYSSASRRVMVIARNGLTEPKMAELIKDYTDATGANSVSFPLGEGAGHLYTRIGNQKLSFGFSGYSEAEYGAPSTWERRLEPVVSLGAPEFAKLCTYVANVKANWREVLGEFTSQQGPKEAKGTLRDNRPTGEGEKHNCTSWMALAPVGDGVRLRDVVSAPRSWEIHTNPGWWSMFLNAASRSQNMAMSVLWLKPEESLEVADTLSGKKLEWNFALK